MKTDYLCKYPPLSKALSEYQQPEKVDKIMRVQSQLDETKTVLVRGTPFRLMSENMCMLCNNIRCNSGPHRFKQLTKS